MPQSAGPLKLDCAGNRVTLAPKHIIMATGNGKAKIPTWPGMDLFAGPLYHSDSHTGAALFKGKRVIVVGAGCCRGYQGIVYLLVTMIQHGATCVISSAAVDKALFSAASSERQTIEDIDFVNHSMPHALSLELVAGGGTKRLKEMDQKLHDDLTKAGFKLTWELAPGDGEFLNSSDLAKRTALGTLLDMGCGQLIVEGKVKVKQGVEIEKLESDGMVFKDVAVFGEGIKEKIGSRIWGLDEERELNCWYRPTGAPGLWFAPGAIQHSRFFSKHVAIQILAQELELKI
ncbi:hypothetical protein B0H14DRAFT_3561397 [Mycena olivaceomarginata]|nr:hypothetical protein B0H14DRAFT_3561397 [Mycena olivaceomarginata]